VVQIVKNLIDIFCDKYSEASYGPAHVVLDDYNLDDDTIVWCQKLLKEAIITRFGYAVESPDPVSISQNFYSVKEGDLYRHGLLELAATHEFLDFLLTIPEEDRQIFGET
jgi:hypothetical protein